MEQAEKTKTNLPRYMTDPYAYQVKRWNGEPFFYCLKEVYDMYPEERRRKVLKDHSAK